MYSVSFMYQFNKYVATFAEQYHPVTAGIIAVNFFVNNSGFKSLRFSLLFEKVNFSVNILPEILYVYLYGSDNRLLFLLESDKSDLCRVVKKNNILALGLMEKKHRSDKDIACAADYLDHADR